MKKLKLFLACLLMAVLSIGQVWGAVYFEDTFSNVGTGSSGNILPRDGWSGSGTTAPQNNTGVRLGASSSGATLTKGAMSNIEGEKTLKVTIYVARYNTNANTLTVTATNGTIESVTLADNVSTGSGLSDGTLTIKPSANAGVTSTTAAATWTDAFKTEFTITGASSTTTISFVSSSRLILGPVKIEDAAAGDEPTIGANPSSVAFGTKNIYDVANQTGSIDVAVSGSNLTGNITAALSGDDASMFSISGAPFVPEEGSASGTLTVSYEVTEIGDYSASLTLSSEGADNVVLPITLTAINTAPKVYYKVTDADELNADDVVIFVYETGKVAAGAMGSNAYLASIDITAALNTASDPASISITDEAVIEFTLSGEAGAWVLTSSEGKLSEKSHSAGSSCDLVKDGETTWSIAISEGNATITGTDNYIQYNTGSPRFRTYKSGQKIIQLYKKSDGTTPKPSAELSYAAADQKKLTKLGETFTAPTLENPNNLTVAYASNNTEVAEVAANGAVTIKAVGVATITASYDGSGDYKEGSASYTIGVTAHAGTEADPYVAADVKIVVDAVETLENAYATGVVSNVVTTTLPQEGYITFYFSADGLTSGQQVEAYKCYGLNSAPFEAVSDVVTGATVIVTGNLKKFNSTYEFDQNCHLVSYTAPAAEKTHIANTKETAYTVAQAITYAADGVTYDLDDYVYVSGVVYDVQDFISNNGTLNIFIKDAGEENQFELYKCAGINDGESTTPFEALTDVQEGDEVIAYGQLTVHNTMSELKSGNYLVELTRPEVAVTSVELDQNAASIEVNETVTLHATVNPDNASNKSITWTVESGNDKASVADGVVTGLVAGEAVIRAASTADPTKYAECTVTVTAADPTKHVVTFDATVDLAENDVTTLTKSNVTIESSDLDGINNTSGNPQAYYQTFKNDDLTISCSAGNITKIELTCESSNPASGFGEGITSGVWTGNAASVTFTADVKQVRINTITVTYKEDTRAAAGLEYEVTAVEKAVGDADFTNTLTNPHSVAVSYETSDDQVAEVDGDGKITIIGEGTATITATFAGDEDYKPAVVSYTLTVGSAALTDYYQKVTETAGIVEGTYLIVYEDESVAFDGGLETLDAKNNTIDVVITNENKIAVTSATEAATFYIDPTAGTIQAANGKYIGVTSNSNGLKTSDNADAYSHNFSIAEGNAVIAAAFEGSTMSLRFNKGTSDKRFRYYSNAGQQPIALYKLANETIKDNPNLVWSGDVEITVGGDFTSPTLSHAVGITGTITYTSDKEAVATVSDAGVISLVENATGTAHITATYGGDENFKGGTAVCTIKVNPAHSIYVSPSLTVNFGSVAKDATVDDKVITVTLTGVDAATATLDANPDEVFSFTPAALTANGDITISASSATVGVYESKLTISDDAGLATSRVVTLKLTVTDPAAEETPISTSTKWVAATAADLVDGAEVIITGVKDEVVYAMGEQKSTNRAGYAASVDGEGILTPGEGTMSFTLVAQEAEGVFALRTSDGKYLYAAGNGANHLKTQDDVDVNAKWTLAVNSAVAESSTNRNIMRFNGSGTNNLFSCYSSGQTEIQFYVPKPVVTYVAQIGETMYESLPAAVAAAEDGQTVNLLMDVAAGPGVMITTEEHKQIIIDFGNHTYCANSPAVGSAGAQNQAFHFEKGCNITLQNGTITSSGNEIIMLIQNYGDLTLKNITLIGNNLPGTHRYVLSNNCGNVVIGEGTTITAKAGDVAFNVCVTNDYPEGTHVTVKGGATITGIVEYGVGGTIPADNKATLTIEGGNFNITWNVESALAEDAKDNINVEGGIFNAEVPADYCAHGYIPVDNGSGQYGVYYAGYYERGSLTPGNYATICLPYAGKISGASLFDIEYFDGTMLYLLEVEGNTMVAGRPYIFLPSSDKIEVTYTDNAGAEAGSFHGLVGSLSLEAEVITANAGNYILYNNQYWYVNSLAYVGANRAYIHMDGVPTEPSTPQVGQAPRRRVAMAVNGKQTTTGIDALNATEAPVKMMINGQLFILRGEKMYNANGQIVK